MLNQRVANRCSGSRHPENDCQMTVACHNLGTRSACYSLKSRRETSERRVPTRNPHPRHAAFPGKVQRHPRDEPNRDIQSTRNRWSNAAADSHGRAVEGYQSVYSDGCSIIGKVARALLSGLAIRGRRWLQFLPSPGEQHAHEHADHRE